LVLDRTAANSEFLDRYADFNGEVARVTKAKHFTYAGFEVSGVDLEKAPARSQSSRPGATYGGANAVD
jgi:hypothetical protein